ncbi:hypothetical protein BAZO_06854 [Schinkia azotoformans LMG 9581]|uniref:Uncharacterized protein n=1 Tax=Schinkia azotoformans LMG 9581 TaxID=1131731 RepID=K6D5W4_SCHAZ|nr:hypothetical protein BAZO_06854 [Schinkia azotoformans LMG 9581]
MDNTIVGAASGETVPSTAPKDSQSQAKEQKSNDNKIVILLFYEIGSIQSHFLLPNVLVNNIKIVSTGGVKIGYKGIKT